MKIDITFVVGSSPGFCWNENFAFLISIPLGSFIVPCNCSPFSFFRNSLSSICHPNSNSGKKVKEEFLKKCKIIIGN